MSLVLPRTDWPRTDRTMWERLIREAGPLDDRGGLAHLRQSSRDILETHYGRWLKWLSLVDPEALSLPPAERATLPRLQSWLEALAHTKPMSRLMFVDGVLRVLRAAAPDRDWALQLRLRAGLKRDAGRGDRARKSGRVLSSAVLLEVGLALAKSDATAVSNRLKQMLAQRDGCMIALLAVLPMRCRAFCGMRLGQSIQVSAGDINIALSEDMTKTGVPWETSVPPQVAPVLRHYIENVRPALLARGNMAHDFLWVGKKGEILDQNHVGSRIGDVTLRLTGVRIPPHLFRDAAATTLARLSPQSARLIPPVLAHSGFQTAERHYIQAQTIEAGRDYAALISQMKKEKR
ncbi:tyrosine-type recombinase/integrase [Pontibaca salina]|uniref:Tyrosine-type recombinase/integrase n=1 Tax=Pontibaca salina TaxID=2795731 RepID=A0A934HTC2_9RHOB|nr:tyrosine-type recombinase/integrase [Pontibaca salina]MBI6630365.1 tyrosine-type recombinase/integrase [Pontibaca salina]